MTYAWTGEYMALQFSEDSTGPWYNLGHSAHWDYADGAGGNGDQVANALLTGTNVRQHFVESSPSAGINSVPSNQYAEWDFCITPVWANVSKGTPYYFKLVIVDGAGNYQSDLVAYPYLAQATTAAGKTWNGSVSTAWNNANNWTPAGVPAAADDVVIPAGTPNQAQLNMNAAGANRIASLTVAAGATLNLNNATAYTLQIDGNASFRGTVNHTTATVNVSGTTVTIAGTYNHTGAGDFSAASASMTVNSGATYIMSGASGDVTVQSLNVSGLFRQETNNNSLTVTNLTINNGGEFRNTRVNLASLVNISGAFTNNGTMSNTTGGNFTFSGAASSIEGSSSTTRFYRFTLQSGTTTISSTGNPSFTALGGGVVLTAGTLSCAGKTIELNAGSWTNNGAALSGAGSTVRFTGGTAVNIDNGAAQTAFQNVEIAKTAGVNVTASRALNIDGNFTITSGNFVPGAFTHTVAGNWSDAGGGFAPAAGTIILDGSSPTITTAAANNFFNLTVSTSGTASMGSSELDVNGALIVSAGATLNCGSNANNDVAGTTTVNGVLNMGTGATNLRGATTVNGTGWMILQTSAGTAPTVRIGTGAAAGSLTINGAFQSAGSPRPALTDQTNQRYAFTVNAGATVDINGLTVDRPATAGLVIANGATITAIDNCYFTNGPGAGATYLTIQANSGSYTCLLYTSPSPRDS